MRKAILGLGLVLLVGLAGCPGPTEPTEEETTLRNLTVNLKGMNPHIGQWTELRVVSTGDQVQARAIFNPLTTADTTIVLVKALTSDESRLDFYADLNLSGSYDAPPADHAWRETISKGSDNVTIDFTHNTTFTDIGSPTFTELGKDFTVNLTDMTPHVGQLYELRVIEKSSGKTVGLYRLGQIESASFSVTIKGIIKDGTEYQIDHYADLNKNGTYDAPPTDHAWRQTETGDANGLTASFTHNVTFTDVGFETTSSALPSLRDLTVNLKDMNPHIDQLTELRVVSSTDQVQARAILNPLTTADVTIAFPNSLTIFSGQKLDFYADFNKNGTYDAPSTDHAWRETISAGGSDVTIDFTHNTMFTDISSPTFTELGKDFTMNLTAMTPHVGQLYELRVIEKVTSKTVGVYRLGSIASADFTVTIAGIIKDGSEYQIDHYADFNKNGTYDAPSTDHAWRQTETGDANGLTASFTHNTDFTDVGF